MKTGTGGAACACAETSDQTCHRIMATMDDQHEIAGQAARVMMLGVGLIGVRPVRMAKVARPLTMPSATRQYADQRRDGALPTGDCRFQSSGAMRSLTSPLLLPEINNNRGKFVTVG